MAIACVVLVGCTSDEVSVYGDVYGTVIDSKSGTPVRNAEVILSPGNRTTVSGNDGHFEFVSLEAGQYKISVDADGYENNSRQVSIIPGQKVTCDIRLSKIVIDQTLKVTPTNLDFGTNQDELSVIITNEGDIETEWSVNLGNNNWLSVHPKAGRISAGKSQTIVFSVNRELVAEEKSAIVSIAAFGNSYPISVSCTPQKTQGELVVEPTTLDFGEESSEKTITLKNVGDASLNWNISNLEAPLSVSEQEGEIAVGGSKVIKVTLDRNKMSEDINTSFIVSDGIHDKQVVVVAKKTVYSAQVDLSTTELDFEDSYTELPLVISNSGNATLNWEIKNIENDCITVSTKKGSLAANGTFKVLVRLNRNLMTSDINDQIYLYDLDSGECYPITIKAEYVVVEDYSSATIATCDPKVSFEITSCKRYGETVQFEFTMTDNGIGDIEGFRMYVPYNEYYSGHSKSVIIDSDGNEYNKSTDVKLVFRNTNTNMGYLHVALPEGVKCKGSITINNVPENITSFKKIQIYVKVYQGTSFMNDTFAFKNVPIF